MRLRTQLTNITMRLVFSIDCRCRPGFLFDVELNKCVTMSECGCMKFDHFFRVSTAAFQNFYR